MKEILCYARRYRTIVDRLTTQDKEKEHQKGKLTNKRKLSELRIQIIICPSVGCILVNVAISLFLYIISNSDVYIEFF